MAGSIAHHLPQDWIYNRQALFYTFPKCLVLSSLLCGSNIIHISEMGKLRHRKFKDIVQIPGLLNGRDEPRRSDSGAHILYLSEQRNKPHPLPLQHFLNYSSHLATRHLRLRNFSQDRGSPGSRDVVSLEGQHLVLEHLADSTRVGAALPISPTRSHGPYTAP